MILHKVVFYVTNLTIADMLTNRLNHTLQAISFTIMVYLGQLVMYCSV